MQIRIAAKALAVILEQAERTFPEEACGLLLGVRQHITDARPTANIASDRTRHFEIDPQTLVDAHRSARGGGAQVLGYYHSHPAGPAEPSAVDRARAAHDGAVWAIAGADDVTFWRDEEAGFVPLSYTVADG